MFSKKNTKKKDRQEVVFCNAENLHLGARKIAPLAENEDLSNFNPMDETARNVCSQYNELCKEPAEGEENFS